MWMFLTGIWSTILFVGWSKALAEGNTEWIVTFTLFSLLTTFCLGLYVNEKYK